jgi:preprotein translocase subunit SecG
MEAFAIILATVAAVLLVLIVMIQNPKGGGLASSFSSANQIGGVRRTTDFLEKATWSLAIGIVGLSLVATASMATGDGPASTGELSEALENARSINAQGQNNFQVDPTTFAPEAE